MMMKKKRKKWTLVITAVQVKKINVNTLTWMLKMRKKTLMKKNISSIKWLSKPSSNKDCLMMMIRTTSRTTKDNKNNFNNT